MLRQLFFLSHIFLLPLIGHAQDIPNFEKKVYTDSKGKVYWNKDVPVFVFLGTSPNEKGEVYNLKSDTSENYADPYFFDTEGPNYIRTKWAVNEDKKTVYPLKEVLWEVFRDGTAPKSSIDFSSENSYASKDAKYVKESAVISIESDDEWSGVQIIMYSIDGEPYKNYEGALTFDNEREYLLRYFSVDNVGNVEDVNEITIIKDKTAPATTLSFEGNKSENVLGKNAKLLLTAEDNFSGVKRIMVSIDGRKESVYTNTLTMYGLQEGEHTISYYAIDKLGNQEDVKTYTFFLDKTGPLIANELLGDKYVVNGKAFASGRTRIKLTAIDNKAGIDEIQYSVNGKEYQAYSQPFFTESSQGQLSIKFYAVDKVGNKSYSSSTSKDIVSPFLDLTGPKLYVKYEGPKFTQRDTLFISPETKIRLSGTDSESGLQSIMYTYDMNSEENLNMYEKSFEPEGTGYRQIKIFGYDNVINSSNRKVDFIVDGDGPEIIPTFSIDPIGEKTMESEKIQVYPSNVSLFVSLTDHYVGYKSIYYKLNSGSEKLYNKEVKGFAPGRDYEISIRATDLLGNETTEKINFSTGK